jgi:hypothetical protein
MILLCCELFLYYFKNIFDKNYFVDRLSDLSIIVSKHAKFKHAQVSYAIYDKANS